MVKRTTISKLILSGAGVLLAGAYARRTRSFSKLDPELRMAPMRLRTPSVGPRSLFMWRAVGSIASKASEGVTMTSYQVPVAAGSYVTVFVYSPADLQPGRPALLYTHGGGMIFGTAAAAHARASHYARELGVVTVSVDYRLAPEHPFPASLNDVLATYQWMIDEQELLGIDGSRVAVGGESAGAGLTAGLCQRLHDERRQAPIMQLLLYPMLDDRTTLRKIGGDQGQLIWSEASNRFAWESYIGGEPGGPGVPEYAAPARRSNLSGLPPAWIGVGTLDLFFDEDVDYARRLEAAGVPCELEVVEGAFHGFDMLPGKRIAQSFTSNAVAAVRAAMSLRPADPD